MGWRFRFFIGVATAVLLGGTPAFADSPEPIDIPDPKRMTVTVRLVETGELIVYDPVAIRFAASRPMPKSVALPLQRRIEFSARTDSIYIALPVRMRAIVSARMDGIDIALPDLLGLSTNARMDNIDIVMPDPLGLSTSAWMDNIDIALPDLLGLSTSAWMDNIDIVMPDPLAVSLSLRIFAADLKMPIARSLYADTMRHAPDGVLITEPLAMTALIRRHMPLEAVRHRE